MRHHRVDKWPNGFPRDVVTRTPSVQELIEIAHRFEFKSEKMLREGPRYLSYMLNGVIWREGVVLKQYVHTMDPYEYHRYCADMDKSNTKANGWLQSPARLLICWMAEELRAKGYGKGYADHFETKLVRTRRGGSDIPSPPPPSPSAEDDDSWGVKLLDYYATEIVEDVVLTTTETVRVDTSQSPVERSFPLPPSQTAQRMRTLGNNEELKEYLRNNASFKKVKGNNGGYLRYHNNTLYKRVGDYLRTDQGLELVKVCDLAPDSVSIDHVWAESLGGPDHLSNYHLMPLRHNSSFNGVPHTHPQKQAYVGKEQMAVLNRLLMEAKKDLPWHDVGY